MGRELKLLVLVFQEKGRISKDGYFIVSSGKTRVQMLNQAECLDRIRNLIWAAAVKPHEPTAEEIALKESR